MKKLTRQLQQKIIELLIESVKKGNEIDPDAFIMNRRASLVDGLIAGAGAEAIWKQPFSAQRAFIAEFLEISQFELNALESGFEGRADCIYLIEMYAFGRELRHLVSIRRRRLQATSRAACVLL